MNSSGSSAIETLLEITKNEKQSLDEVHGFEKMILRSGSIYKKHFSDRILGVDDINSDKVNLFLRELIDFLSEQKQSCEDWEFHLLNAKAALYHWRLKSCLSRSTNMLLMILEKAYEANEVPVPENLSNLSIQGAWELIIKYCETEFDYNKPFFDENRLNEFPRLKEDLNKFISIYAGYFSMHDENEKNYRSNINKESLGTCRKALNEHIENIGDSFFNDKFMNQDKAVIESIIKSKDAEKRKEYIEFVGELAKKYFLRKFLIYGIISKSYFDFILYSKKGWDGMKELFYSYRRFEKKNQVIPKNHNLPEALVSNINKAIEDIMQQDPKMSYRLLRNLLMTVSSLSLLLNGLKGNKGIRLDGIENIEISIAGKGEDVVFGEGHL